MTTITELRDLHSLTGVSWTAEEIREQTPGRPAAQGDITIIPQDVAARNGATIPTIAAWAAVPPAGVVVADAGHPHILIGQADWTTQVTDETGLAVGAARVPEGGDCWLHHPEEHQAIRLAPGVHILRRAREMAAEIRLVQD